VVHAVTEAEEGLEAIYAVALWLDGQYRFEEGGSDVPITVTKANPTILMELGKRMDEWRILSQKISSIDLYPCSNLLPGETPAGVNPREAKLLEMVTGYYTVAELAEVLQRPILAVAKDLYGLIMAGHVFLKGVRSGKAPKVDAPPAPRVEAAPAPAPEAPKGFPAAAEAVAPAAPAASMAMPADPMRMAKLTAFTQRIAQASKGILPPEQHEMVDRLQAKTTTAIFGGEGPDALRELALAISRSAVEAGVSPDIIRLLNATLKSLFGSK